MVNIPHIVDNKVVKYTYDDVQRDFKPFLSDGYVSSVDGDNRTPIRILRDTGASRSLLLQGAVQLPDSSYTGERAIIQGVDMKYIPLPLHNINLECGIVNGKVTVGVLHSLPCEGISLLIGNDSAGGKVYPAPVVCDTPLTEIEHPEMCNVITRAASKRIEQYENVDVLDGLQDTFLNNSDTNIVHIQNQSCGKKKHITDQQNDETLTSFYDDLVSICDIDDHDVCYYTKSGIFMRKFRLSDAKLDESWRIRHHIVLPQSYRDNVPSIAHDIPLAGHLGVNKTTDRILQHFFWPGIRGSVAKHCKTCHTCQVEGKPNKTILRAPLHPIPAFDEAFSKVIIDCVGPLLKTKAGNEYLLTIMCSSTRFPETIPLRNIKAKRIVEHLVKCFTFVGLPKAIQSELSSNFTSNIFKVYPSRESDKLPLITVGSVIPSTETETSIDHYDIETDISDVGAGAVLTQLCSDGLDHPISYYSKKFNKHQHTYATVEKECYALVLSLQHFDVYINVTRFPVLVFTDHNPLVFMSRMKDKNQKILRWSLIILLLLLIIIFI